MMILGATFLGALKWIGYLLVALLCLMFMIIVHESGHYAAGKFFKFNILEFSIGFGPKIFQKKNKQTGELFSIRCIPLGGYCQFAGEDQDVENEGDFNSKPAWQRIIVLFAGAFCNLISAVLIISIFFMAYGEFFPTVNKQYEFVDSNYEQVLKEGDIIYKIDGKKCYSLLENNKMSQYLNGKEQVEVEVIRNGENIKFEIQKHDYHGVYEDINGDIQEIDGHGLGIAISYTRKHLDFFDSIGHAFGFIFNVIALIFKTFGAVFTGSAKVSESLGGTVTAISTLAQLTEAGLPAVMYGVCVLSASIGVMNLLPFPALDGCRIVICFIEMIIRKPLNKKVEAIIHTFGLVFLFAIAIIFDLLHFIG